MTKLHVNINDETAQALEEITARRGESVTEVFRRAVSVLKFLDDETSIKGQTLRLVDKKAGVYQDFEIAD